MFRHCEAFLIPHGGIATVVLLRDSISAPLCFEAPAEAVWSLDLGPFIILRIRICILGTALYSVSAFRIHIRIRFRGSRAPAQAHTPAVFSLAWCIWRLKRFQRARDSRGRGADYIDWWWWWLGGGRAERAEV